MDRNIPVVILCGGFGTRIRVEEPSKPKALVLVGDRPILWHLMKIYSHFGFNNFILCLGYQGNLIKEYFLNYEYSMTDFTLRLGSREKTHFHNAFEEKWTITFAETGLETQTGGRIKRIEKYVQTDYFLATYADGLADIDIQQLVAFHKEQGKTGTMTGVHPITNFGVIDLDKSGTAIGFREKPQQNEWINGGFFVFNREFFKYLDENCILERNPLEQLSRNKELAIFQHTRFWKCMDTFKDAQAFNELWNHSGRAPWAVWTHEEKRRD